jgi:penicillin-binding protein 2
MDVRSGDILALASSPTVNPNDPVRGFTQAEWQRRKDTVLRPELNRATQGSYAPASIFKTVVGLAALEAGLDHNEIFRVAPNPARPASGIIYIGPTHRPMKDTAPPGDYDFRRALKLSSNSYFVTNGLRMGPERIVALGQKFHFGERIGLPLRQETSGYFPTVKRVTQGWTEGNTANLCIGQDPVQVTPLQIAVMTAALANGGRVLWPRLVERIESQDPISAQPPVTFPSGRVRNQIGVSPRSLAILHEAMLADTEDADGTGRDATVPGLRICGKTGTAQIQDVNNEKTGQTTWFASFAPFGSPRWAVVVMVEDGISGAKTCAPLARPIYAAILQRELSGPKSAPLAAGAVGR